MLAAPAPRPLVELAALRRPARPLAERDRPRWYVALGDSLSQGLQPVAGRAGAGRETDQGYPDVVAGDLGLRLVKLGCPGETTTTMLHGGICYRDGASQIGAATAYLRAHRGQVALVTVDIGINDVIRCEQMAPGPRSAACLGRGLATVGRNLPTVLRQVRDAAGPGVRIVALDYYAPFVAAHRVDEAAWSQYVTGRLDATLAGVAGPRGVAVAAVGPAFGLGGTAAAEAAEVCRLTWVCSPPPVGPNLHANAAGYRAMAGAVVAALGPGPLRPGPMRAPSLRPSPTAPASARSAGPGPAPRAP